MNTLHEEIEHLVDHLVGFSFIRVYDVTMLLACLTLFKMIF